MTTRAVLREYRGLETRDGAGVSLRRFFGFGDSAALDPFLLLDAFGSERPQDYLPGFPWHPHRGIETVTYLLKGKLRHGDSLGNSGLIGPGELQWMTAGSGIIHEEMPQLSEGGVFGFQLWVNLAASEKMCEPAYRGVLASEPPIVEGIGFRLSVLAGEFQGRIGPVRGIAREPSYFDIELEAGASIELPTRRGSTAFAHVFEGSLALEGGRDEGGKARTILFGPGEEVLIRAGLEGARCLFASASPLHEPIAWGGPIVMNTQEELELAFKEFEEGHFVKLGPALVDPGEGTDPFDELGGGGLHIVADGLEGARRAQGHAAAAALAGLLVDSPPPLLAFDGPHEAFPLAGPAGLAEGGIVDYTEAREAMNRGRGLLGPVPSGVHDGAAAAAAEADGHEPALGPHAPEEVVDAHAADHGYEAVGHGSIEILETFLHAHVARDARIYLFGAFAELDAAVLDGVFRASLGVAAGAGTYDDAMGGGADEPLHDLAREDAVRALPRGRLADGYVAHVEVLAREHGRGEALGDAPQEGQGLKAVHEPGALPGEGPELGQDGQPGLGSARHGKAPSRLRRPGGPFFAVYPPPHRPVP